MEFWFGHGKSWKMKITVLKHHWVSLLSEREQNRNSADLRTK